MSGSGVDTGVGDNVGVSDAVGIGGVVAEDAIVGSVVGGFVGSENSLTGLPQPEKPIANNIRYGISIPYHMPLQ